MSKEIESKLDALIASKQEKDQKNKEAATQESAIKTANYNEFLDTIESQVLPAMKSFSQLLDQRDIRSEIDESRLRGGCPEINYNSVQFEVHPTASSISHVSSKIVIQREPKNNKVSLKRSEFKSQLGDTEETSRPVSLTELTNDLVTNELLTLIKGLL